MIFENNDYSKEESEYSYKWMIELDNMVMFWSKEYGDDLMINMDMIKCFDLKNVIVECECFYKFYVNDLKLV